MLPQNAATTCASCAGRERSEWCALSRDELGALDRAKVRHAYGAGQAIFYQGNPCLGLHCIEEGTVALRKADPSGAAVIIRLVHPSETLGCRTFFGGGPYSATAVAVTPARVCFIERSTITALLARSPQLAGRFLRRMAEDLRAADDEKLEAASLPVRARLSRLLIALSDRYGVEQADGAFQVELPVARQDMAALLGVRPESIARAVAALARDGVASFDGRNVRVQDINRLMAEVSATAQAKA